MKRFDFGDLILNDLGYLDIDIAFNKYYNSLLNLIDVNEYQEFDTVV